MPKTTPSWKKNLTFAAGALAVFFGIHFIFFSAATVVPDRLAWVLPAATLALTLLSGFLWWRLRRAAKSRKS